MCVIYPLFEIHLKFRFAFYLFIFFHRLAVSSHCEEWEERRNRDVTKEKRCKYNTVTEKIQSSTEPKIRRKKANSINIYGTHLWHKYAAVGLATSLFFKPNYHGNSAKREEVGRTWAFHRALAKIHSKKSDFIQNILF